MINKILCAVIATSLSLTALAQKHDGTVKSLVNADKEFSETAVKSGIKSAFNNFAANDALVFRPNPVNAKAFYSTEQDAKNLSWTPVFAKVSRSADWGFTTGPYVVEGTEKSYGDYLTLWKMVNGKWMAALDVATSHNKPLTKAVPQFVDPLDFYRPKYTNEKDILTGKGIILTTEKTLDATLKSYGIAAFGGFLNPDARLLFPGREPIIGKDNIISFYNGMVSKITLKTTKAEKAAGGDLAYTYGVATIDYKADLRESFNYVNVYERQVDHTWNLILQMYSPAER
ncbi:MAG: nuclear transport factor 2 family protein [Pedobacter sp.]|nr:MAG: nuclear transport factor 2 family protein [Pedobacter sp.]